MSKFIAGQPVTIARSTHPDIRAGAVGTYQHDMQGGYAVAVEVNYYQVTGGTKFETRVIFVGTGDLIAAKDAVTCEGGS